MTPEEKQQLLQLMVQQGSVSGYTSPGQNPGTRPAPPNMNVGPGLGNAARERVMPEQTISGNAPQSPAQSMGLSEKQALLRAIQSVLSGEQSPDESMLGPRPEMTRETGGMVVSGGSPDQGGTEGLFGKMAYHGMEPGRMATGQVQLSPDVVRRAGQNAQMREAAQGAMTSDPQAALSGMSREQLLEMLSRLRQQQ